MTAPLTTRVIAGAAVVALALTPAAAMASDDAPKEPLEPRGTQFSVGQSVQIRTDANGVPNSSITNFRWSITQVSAQGEGDTFTATVPEDGLGLRSLQDFGNPPQENGQATLEIDLDNGFGTARTVSLFPPDDELPVEIKAEFTLDGQPIQAQDLVGEDGVVTATYTVTNKTRQTMTVPITSVTGDEVEKEVEADVPMVVEASAFIPDRFSALNTGAGLGGADGRGNVQVKWIALPFAPLSEDGTATFGWAANVRDAVIPAMLVQVLPVYIPEHGDDAEEAAETVVEAAQRAGVEPPNVSDDVATIKDGVANIVSGLEQITADDGSPDPLTVLEGRVNEFFTEFGDELQTVSSLVNPNNPDGATALVKELQATVADSQAKIAEIESSGVLDQIERAASILTPETAESVAGLVDYADELSYLADNASTVKAIADNASAIASGINLGCIDPPGPTEPALPPEICNNKDAIIAVLESQELQQISDILNSNQFQQAAAIISSPEFAQAAGILPQVAAALDVLNRQLPGIITTLKPVLSALDSVLASLEDALVGLSGSLQTIGEGLAERNISLPTLDAVIQEVVDTVLSSPGGQDLTKGLDQVSAGVGGVKSELSAFAAELAVALQAAKAEVSAAVEEGREAVAEVVERADTLKARVAGLVTSAHQSPLPYGGDPTQAPEGTKLAGAYEFRMDPADTEQPSTLPRILIAVILLLVAGFVGNWAATRRPAAAAAGAGAGAEAGEAEDTGTSEGAPEGDSPGGPEPEGQRPEG